MTLPTHSDADEVYVPGPPERVSPDDPLIHGRRWRAERDCYREALEALRIYLRVGSNGRHTSLGEACGEDACILCLAESTVAEALGSPSMLTSTEDTDG